MMDTKHTKAPLKAITDRGISVVDKDGRSVCAMASNSKRPYEERVANAVLFAAAPELLEALNDLVCYIGEFQDGSRCQFPDDCLINAELLIHKATGREHKKGKK